MPNWQPNWNNIRWNQGAASAAADALRRAATQLDEATNRRASLAAIARQEWRGHYRLQFDSELQADLNNYRDLAERMRRAAAQIEDTSRRARSEQTRREQDRERWRREKEKEDREKRERERNKNNTRK